MTIAAKAFDPILGVDIHIVLIPMPAPTPVPLPHPFIGMVLDPTDFIPMVGASVLVNGLPRGQAGTGGKAIPPHIPMGGPFQLPPGNEGEIFMGSATVLAEDEPLSFLGLPVLTCSDIGMPGPPRKKGASAKSLMMPMSVVLCIPAGLPVLVGGPPTISMMGMGMKAGMAGLGKLGKKLRKAQKGTGKFGRKMRALSARLRRRVNKFCRKHKVSDAWRNRLNSAICTVTGHPVDIPTGKVFTDLIDFELPGGLDLVWERIWFSTSTYRGPLGHGWHHSYDIALYEEDDLLVLRWEDGRFVGLPRLSPGESYYSIDEKLTLSRDASGYLIVDSAKKRYHFSRVDQHAKAERLRELDAVNSAQSLLPDFQLTRIDNAAGDIGLSFGYDGFGRLEWLSGSAGQQLRLQYYPKSSLISDIFGPSATDGSMVVYVHYDYDSYGNLICATDSERHRFLYQYQGHLLSKETTRNGLSFYFEYQGTDEHASCIRTWGDGRLYSREIQYFPEQGLTEVIDSFGSLYRYFHDGCQVLKTEDPMGAISETEFDESYRPIASVDSLGRRESYSYDARGNLQKVQQADGSAVAFEFDDKDSLLKMVDEIGAEWLFEVDAYGQTLKSIDPLGRCTEFEYSGGLLVAAKNPLGEVTRLVYDQKNRLEYLLSADGTSLRWGYNPQGYLGKSWDERGNITEYRWSDSGNLLTRHLPDGDVEEYEYDPEGNTTRFKSAQYDIRMGYQGLSNLSFREQNGQILRFNYDTEGQLLAIQNAHGRVYEFVYDANGLLLSESGFGGLKWQFDRDLAGQVKKLRRASGIETEYRYDPVGRLVAKLHSNGEKCQFAYRADGSLKVANTEAVSVRFEYDAAGQILKEFQDQHWISRQYDALGRVKELESSLGAKIKTDFGIDGDWRRLECSQGSASIAVDVSRDASGLELERSLPGGLKSRWDRDKLGRPISREVTSQGHILKAHSYAWDMDNRLKSITDALKGTTRYQHDGFGNLSAAHSPSGAAQFRMPDAVGNLFKTDDRSDRIYGPAGELLEARSASGTTQYSYDAEGNLIRKLERRASGAELLWEYRWNAAGQLAEVLRPDGNVVKMVYDALGRRVTKNYRGQTTRFVWNGDTPLHEWVEGRLVPSDPLAAEPLWFADAELKKREAELSELLAQGPPQGAERDATGALAASDGSARGTLEKPITWLFEPESFIPAGRLQGGRQHSILTDHLGSPILLVDEAGKAAWSADYSIYGELQNFEGLSAPGGGAGGSAGGGFGSAGFGSGGFGSAGFGSGSAGAPSGSSGGSAAPLGGASSDEFAAKAFCPFRYPGQYEDVETGLYYNRFRYYDPEAGQYISQDPIGLAGGLEAYNYVHDPLTWEDPLGLKKCNISKEAKAKLGPAPTGMTKAHMHHIVMEGKFSRWKIKNRRYVRAAQMKLKKYGVDIQGPDNIMWAKNEAHSVEYAKRVWKGLEGANSKKQVEAALSKIRKGMEDGSFWN